MKKAPLVILLLLLLAAPLKSEVVSRDEALKVAGNFLAPATRGTGSRISLVWDGESEQTRNSAAPAFYVFASDGGGFVVVSGENSIAPVLAYSYSGRFSVEGMPENLEAWFSELKENVNSHRGCTATPQVAQKWLQLSGGTKAAVAEIPSELLYRTAKWGQDYPFNLMCPIDHMYEKSSKVGCTAVSFAQLLYYWKWPEAGVGTLPSYWATDKHYVAPEIILGHKYQWDKMLDDYYAEEHTPEQDTAVAILCRDVAQGGRTIFGANGASGDQTKFLQRLTEPMQLSHRVCRMFRIHFTTEGWVDAIKEGLQYGPVYYCLFHNDGGHSIVADGYDSNGFIHFNWGFYGMNDGYYDTAIDNLNGPMFYPNSHSAFTGVGPRRADDIQDGTLYYGNGVKCGITVTSGTPAEGSSFEVSLTNFYSSCPFDFQPEYVVAHCDKDFNIKSLVSDVSRTPLMESGTYTAITGIACTITKPIEYGDALAMFYRVAGAGQEWRLTRFSVQADAKIVNGVYRLTEEKSVAQGAALSYNPADLKYTITCTKEATCTLFNEDGSAAGGVSGGDGTFVIDASSLQSGRYKVVLSHKKYKDIKEFVIAIR